MVINDGGNVNDIIDGDDNGRDDDKGYHQYTVLVYCYFYPHLQPHHISTILIIIFLIFT